MLEVLTLAAAVWLLYHVVKLVLRITWGLTKAVAVVLLILALPVLAVCLLLAGGVALLVPVALIAGAWGILKACI